MVQVLGLGLWSHLTGKLVLTSCKWGKLNNHNSIYFHMFCKEDFEAILCILQYSTKVTTECGIISRWSSILYVPILVKKFAKKGRFEKKLFVISPPLTCKCLRFLSFLHPCLSLYLRLSELRVLNKNLKSSLEISYMIFI